MNIENVKKSAKRLQEVMDSSDVETRDMLDTLSWRTLMPLDIEPIDILFRRIAKTFMVMGIASKKDTDIIVEELAITAAHLENLHAHAAHASVVVLIGEEMPNSYELKNAFMREAMNSGNKDYRWVEFSQFLTQEMKEAYADNNGICKDDVSVISNCNNSLDQIQDIVDSYENQINNFHKN